MSYQERIISAQEWAQNLTDSELFRVAYSPVSTQRKHGFVSLSQHKAAFDEIIRRWTQEHKP